MMIFLVVSCFYLKENLCLLLFQMDGGWLGWWMGLSRIIFPLAQHGQYILAGLRWDNNFRGWSIYFHSDLSVSGVKLTRSNPSYVHDVWRLSWKRHTPWKDIIIISQIILHTQLLFISHLYLIHHHNVAIHQPTIAKQWPSNPSSSPFSQQSVSSVQHRRYRPAAIATNPLTASRS